MKKNIYNFICKNCGKHYTLELTEQKYLNGNFPFKNFCCKSCANSRKMTSEIKTKIKNSIIKSERYHDSLQIKRKNNPEKYIYSNGKYEIRPKYYHCGTKELNDKYPEISHHKTKKWFNKLIPFGFDINTLGTKNIIKEYYKCKDLLYNEYVINKLSPADIYKKYNCSKYINNFETLLYVFKEWGFNTRGHSEAVKECFLQNKLSPPETNSQKYQYKSGWHTTWNGKEVYYRSSYELEYAKVLDNIHINYDMECLRIKYFDSTFNEYRCAIPDFYLIDENTIVEIKSLYSLNIQNMKDKFQEYEKLGYKTKLILEHKEVDLYSL